MRSGDGVPHGNPVSVGELIVNLEAYIGERGAEALHELAERGGEVIELLQRAGNAELLEEWRSWEARRLRGQRPLVRSLVAQGVLRHDLSVDRAADILWMLTGRDVYAMLVTQRGWSGDYYERWLAGVLARELLERQDQQSAPP